MDDLTDMGKETENRIDYTVTCISEFSYRHSLSYQKVISELTDPFADCNKNVKPPPKLITLDSMTKEEFDAMIEESYKQAINGEGLEINIAFEQLRKELKPKQ